MFENLLEIETRDLSAQIMLANSELQEYGEDTGVEGDSFYSVIRGFCSESAAEMEEIQNMFETMSQRAYATTSYFGESALSSEKLFEMIQKFVARYKEAQSEHGWLIKNNMLPAP